MFLKSALLNSALSVILLRKSSKKELYYRMIRIYLLFSSKKRYHEIFKKDIPIS